MPMRGATDTLPLDRWVSPRRRRLATAVATVLLFACSGDTVKAENPSAQQETPVVETPTTRPEVTVPETPSQIVNRRIGSQADEVAESLTRAIDGKGLEGSTEDGVTTYNLLTAGERALTVVIGRDEEDQLTQVHVSHDFMDWRFTKTDGWWAATFDDFDGVTYTADAQAAQEVSSVLSGDRIVDNYLEGLEVTVYTSHLAPIDG
jgi:hypothetical protein